MKEIDKLNKLCRNQLLNKSPILYKYTFKENIIRRLLILSNKSKIINVNKYFWHTALLTIGKERHYKLSKDKTIIKELEKYYNSILLKKRKGYKTVQVVDQVMNLYTLLYLKYELNISKYDELIEEGIEFINNIYDGNSVIPYRDNNKDLILIDTLGMICPFLMRYYYYTGKKIYADIAINQLKDFMLNGIDNKDYFPYHSYNLSVKENIGSSQWGRGIGWMLIGIIDSIEYIDKNSHEYKLLTEYLICFINELVKYQDENGYFKCNVKEENSHIDSSATAFIGYSIGRAVELNVLGKEYVKCVKKCCYAIEKSMDDKGRVWDCSEDCSGVGEYSMKFSCNLANGISLALVSIYEYINNRDSSVIRSKI
ncbi:TPA: hypothetical protein I9Z81_001236 [Clostridium perfringens]|uniref:glycoside hydrolase family 88 protein n=1 Tax=Clostridium perfringens TaxID=1502 RepID=UPI001A1807FE|nr:glycoside hydrolase family 88 protein [Clostridium perfringens]UBK74357.1 glycoside hydrolase family 88 protein [Clostridium perfringens]HAT4143112.1 hypothetical protein [Clostridium perfringens]HAT4146244.1 hypothetical protein [Clostridium perfringens]